MMLEEADAVWYGLFVKMDSVKWTCARYRGGYMGSLGYCKSYWIMVSIEVGIVHRYKWKRCTSFVVLGTQGEVQARGMEYVLASCVPCDGVFVVGG